jgi:glycerol-3-phosphate O-acyltransferase
MTSTIEIPVWLFILILAFAAVTAASHFLLPSVRWFFRRRMERVVGKLNERLDRPIEPFKLARRHDMIQRLLYDPEVTKGIVEYAQEHGVPENVAFQKARTYAREIVPSFSASAYFGFAIRAAKFLSTALYRVRLGYYDEEALGQIDKEATVVFVMNHRSNMDYVLVTYLAAQRSALAYAVGEWARVWPLSGLIRAMGAYFIRRKSRNPLYRRVLARYVHMATQGGVTQAMFPEGGLSLDGALQTPKVGLLKYMTDGFDPAGRDVVFVPVALNYDRVLEDRVLIAAAGGGVRRFQARISVVAGFMAKQLWLRLRGKYHKFGYAAVSFGKPVSLREFSERGAEELSEALAQELITRIKVVVPVLPVPLVAGVILDADGMITRDGVVAEFTRRVNALAHAHVHLPRDDVGYATEVGLRILIERRMIVKVGEGYRVAPNQQDVLAFYANSISHLLK